MNKSFTEKIKSDFDQIARFESPDWNHNNHYHRFLLKQLPRHCTRVLEIGCGTGEFSRLLAREADQVIAIDLSPNMIEVAKQQSEGCSNIEFHAIDVLAWDFSVEEFDAIISIATFHHVSLETLLPRLKTALKPGGKLIILDLLKQENLVDRFSDVVAVPLNWLLQIAKNKGKPPTPEATALWREHLRTDEYLTRHQAQQIYEQSLPAVQIKKHLFWRYSAVWQKSKAVIINTN